MDVVKVKVEIEVGKETKEVADVIAELVKDIRAGKKIEALTENLAGVMKAVEGYDMLDDEQKDASRHGTRGYFAMKLSEALDLDKPTP